MDSGTIQEEKQPWITIAYKQLKIVIIKHKHQQEIWIQRFLDTTIQDMNRLFSDPICMYMIFIQETNKPNNPIFRKKWEVFQEHREQIHLEGIQALQAQIRVLPRSDNGWEGSGRLVPGMCHRRPGVRSVRPRWGSHRKGGGIQRNRKRTDERRRMRIALRENSEFCSYTIHPDSGSGPFNVAELTDSGSLSVHTPGPHTPHT
jgi:hypothetical protein